VSGTVRKSARMLAAPLFVPMLSALITTAAVAASSRARRLLATRVLACRAALVMSLFATAAVAAWVPTAAVAAFCGILAALALWTTTPVRRRWGDPLPPGPKWDWERFDAAFRAHVERSERRQRHRGQGDG
jgi:hypothetical protein